MHDFDGHFSPAQAECSLFFNIFWSTLMVAFPFGGSAGQLTPIPLTGEEMKT
jgi:hypothetical protein